MNPYQQPPDPKRFRPNSNNNNADRPWIPPPSQQQPYQPHVHPSHQSQLPPPPPIAPYHQSQTQQPPFYPPAQISAQPLPPHSNPYNAMPHALRRNKSSDPRQQQRHRLPMNAYSNPHTHTQPQSMMMMDNNNNKSNDAILDVLHIAADETKNFGSFAVTMNQIYGSRNVDPLPFGSNLSSAISFDGRIRSQPILSFLPQAMEGPSKKVRVYELSPLAAADKQSYDELVAFFTKNGRCPVVDKEYNLGILLYLIPPKLIFKKVDPASSSSAKEEKLRKKHRKKQHRMDGNETNKINFVQLLGLNASEVKEDKVWMISIISTSKYLLYKQKVKEKGLEKEKKQKKKKKKKKKGKNKKVNEADLSDIEISDDEEDDSESLQSESDNFEDEEDENGQSGKEKKEEIVKSNLIIALEELYKKIGQRLPD